MISTTKLVAAAGLLGPHAVREAAAIIAPFALCTPILRSDHIDSITGIAVHFKCEHLQLTGSFKARGALNAVMSLPDDVAARGVVAHSTGNHGAAVAFAARIRGVPCTIVIPTTTPTAKASNIARYGATLVRCAPTPAAREAAAAAEAAKLGGSIIHPFDDALVVAGQGTIGAELLDQVAGLDAILVPVSGGGMLAGIAAACSGTRTRVIAVEPQGKRLRHALEAGARCVFSPEELRGRPTVPTVADAIPTILLGERVAWPVVRALVDPRDVVTVDDAAIGAALRLASTELKQAVEPAGAVTLAGLLSPDFRELRRDEARPLRNVAAVMSGGNVDLATLARLLSPLALA